MNKWVNHDELKIQVLSRGVFLFVSLLVLMRMMMMMVMMSLSWACLGGEGTRYLWFQHCIFHSETEGAPGSLTQLHISPMPPPHLSLSLPTAAPPHVSVTFWLQCWLCLHVLPSFPPMLNAMSASLLASFRRFHLSPRHVFSAPHPFFCLQVWLEMRYESGIVRNVSVSWHPSLGIHPEPVCECSRKDQKDESRSAAARKKSISVWLRRDWRDRDY